MSVDSRDFNESTKCGGKFSEDFPRAPKLKKAHRSIITANTLRFMWKPKRENHGGERDSTLIRKNCKKRSVTL